MVLPRLVMVTIWDRIVPFKLLVSRYNNPAKASKMDSENGEQVTMTKNATAMPWSKVSNEC